FVIVDGTLIRAQRHRLDRPCYSGKHRHHGMNLQAVASPAGGPSRRREHRRTSRRPRRREPITRAPPATRDLGSLGRLPSKTRLDRVIPFARKRTDRAPEYRGPNQVGKMPHLPPVLETSQVIYVRRHPLVLAALLLPLVLTATGCSWFGSDPTK